MAPAAVLGRHHDGTQVNVDLRARSRETQDLLVPN
jgi:hypothetical protein